MRKLVIFTKANNNFPIHKLGLAYSSVMFSLLMHNLGCAESLLTLQSKFGNEWFPVTSGFILARSMFEADINAHYISEKPQERVPLYINYGHIVDKKQMDAYSKHRDSSDPTWREAMNFEWPRKWAHREKEINSNYRKCSPLYMRRTKKGKETLSQSWSGKNIRQMAIDVNHEEAYDIFYSDLSSFTHSNVKLADRFLRLDKGEASWTMRAKELDVASVFRYADIFLTCNLKLFGKEFNTWSEVQVHSIWDF